MSTIEDRARAAKGAANILACVDTPTKNAVLRDLAAALHRRRGDVFSANRADMDAARREGLPEPKLRRLEITEKGLEQMVAGLGQVADLPDPVGAVVKEYDTPAGLHVRKVRVPLGVIAMIYEARPNVTIDAFALCFKAGNACFLKGGKEAAHSNALLADAARDALRTHRLPEAAVTAMTSANRDEIRRLLTLSEYLDLVIPRGGAELIRFVHEHAKIPMVQHFHGVCHIYVDEFADREKALAIAVTAKTSAPATCNAAECVLVHQARAADIVPELVRRYRAAGVEVRGDEAVCRLASEAAAARADDWGREFLDLVVAMKVVPDAPAAIAHIQRYGSNHTDAIVSENHDRQAQFIAGVGSSCVLTNASTRFNDGFQLGLGAEIGISTSRIHAYGPMGLEELTTQRYVVTGTGQTR